MESSVEPLSARQPGSLNLFWTQDETLRTQQQKAQKYVHMLGYTTVLGYGKICMYCCAHNAFGFDSSLPAPTADLISTGCGSAESETGQPRTPALARFHTAGRCGLCFHLLATERPLFSHPVPTPACPGSSRAGT